MSPKKKKLTFNDLGEMLGHVVKSIADLPTRDEVVTKDSVRQIVREEVREELRKELKPVETRLMAIESKVSGVDRRLDAEAMRRDDEKIPARIAHLEKKVFGTPRTSA